MNAKKKLAQRIKNREVFKNTFEELQKIAFSKSQDTNEEMDDYEAIFGDDTSISIYGLHHLCVIMTQGNKSRARFLLATIMAWSTARADVVGEIPPIAMKFLNEDISDEDCTEISTNIKKRIKESKEQEKAQASAKKEEEWKTLN